MAQLAMKYGIKNMTHSEQESIKPDTGIDWNHYNYPPCLKIFHYSREHVPEDLKRLVFLLWFNHILILVTTVFNFVTNIVATATGYPDAWIQLVISIFLLLLWTPLGLYLFYLPYMILLKGEGSRMVFYLISLVTFIWFLIWAVANFADANGFVRASDYFNTGKGAAGGFAIVESILCLMVSIVTTVNTVWFWRN